MTIDSEFLNAHSAEIKRIADRLENIEALLEMLECDAGEEEYLVTVEGDFLIISAHIIGGVMLETTNTNPQHLSSQLEVKAQAAEAQARAATESFLMAISEK